MQCAAGTGLARPCLKGAAVPLRQKPVVARADETNAGAPPATNGQQRCLGA